MGTFRNSQGLPADSRQWPFVLAVSMLFGTLASVLTAWACNPRPALTPDSMYYINAAQNIFRGKGFVLTLMPAPWGGSSLPYASWPPLYPLVLASGLTVFSDPVSAARWIQIIVTGLTAIPLGLLTYRAAGRAFLSPVLGFYAILLPHVQTASFVWSEPLYTLLTYSTFAMVVETSREGRHHRSRRDAFLITAGFLAGLAMLTRYLGLSVILSVWIFLIVQGEEDLSGRATLRQMLLFGAPALLPNLVWLARNLATTGFLFGERRVVGGSDIQSSVLGFFHTFWGNTVAPASIQGSGLPIPEVILGIASAAVLLGVAAGTYGPHTASGNAPRGRIASLLLTHLVLYSILLVAISMRVSFDPISTRFLAPIYPGFLVLFAFLLRPVFAERSPRSTAVRAVVIAAGSVLLIIQARATVRYIGSPYETKQMTAPYWRSIVFSDPAWKSRRDLVELTRAVPPESLILSNVADVIAIWTGRTAQFLPYADDVRAGELIRSRTGAFVFVHPEYRRPWIGKDFLDRLVDEGSVQRLGPCGEGFLYRVEG